MARSLLRSSKLTYGQIIAFSSPNGFSTNIDLGLVHNDVFTDKEKILENIRKLSLLKNWNFEKLIDCFI